MNNGTNRLLLLAVLALTGCGKFLDPNQAVTDQQQNFSLNGVKAIKANNNDPADASSFGQTEFEISPTSRLLLRFEELSQYTDEVRTEDGKKVELLLTPIDRTVDGLANAEKVLKICGMTKNWMMLSTWTRAYPFDSTGIWTEAGGDFDPNECFTTSTADGSSLVFDVTPWFLDYVRGRKINYGLILLSDVELKVEGDKSGSYSPRIRWKKSSF